MLDFLKQTEVTLQEIQKTIKELPLPEKVKAIAIYKRYQQIRKIEEEMNAATRVIEKKYLKLDQPILKNVAQLVGGQRAIRPDELHDLDKYLNEEDAKKVEEHLEPRKIEGYWSKCLSNAPMIKEQMGKEDDALLKCIQEVHVEDVEDSDDFTIVFAMKENDIIKNKQLRKKFYLKESSPVKSEGTAIEWCTRNLTMKEVKKKQKNKKTGQQRVVTKHVKAKSFFNFFGSVDLTDANPNPLQATEEQITKREELEQDFEVGGVLVDEVLPYSLEYYLGVKHEGDDDMQMDSDMGEDDEDDEDAPKAKKGKGSKSKSKSKSKGKDKKQDEKPECKQQ